MRVDLPRVSGVIFLSAYVRGSSEGPSVRSARSAGLARAERPAAEVSEWAHLRIDCSHGIRSWGWAVS